MNKPADVPVNIRQEGNDIPVTDKEIYFILFIINKRRDKKNKQNNNDIDENIQFPVINIFMENDD